MGFLRRASVGVGGALPRRSWTQSRALLVSTKGWGRRCASLSHVQGSKEEALIEDDIGTFFDRQCRTYSSETAFHSDHQGQHFTWDEMKFCVDRFAAGLARLGYRPGDRLGIWLPNRSEWVIAQYASAKLGVILVNINPACQESELYHIMSRVEPKGLIVTETFRGTNYPELIQRVIPELEGQTGREGLDCPSHPELRHIIGVDTSLNGGERPYVMPFEDVYHNNPNLLVKHELRSTDGINIQFTSGTSGPPKPSLLTHRGILNNGKFIGQRMQFTNQDTLCIPVPLFHCFGMVIGNLTCLVHGSKFVYPSEAFDAGAVLSSVEKHGCTALHGVPTMFGDLLDHPDLSKRNISTLRTGVMAGSNCPIDLMRRVRKDMHMEDVTIAYGMTETSPVSWQTEPHHETEVRCETVGSVHPHVECKVVDEMGRVVPVGEKGELYTRGYSVMLSYYSDREATQSAIDSEGWMKTGDMVTIDEHGHCRVVGRYKDLIIRGGENIYPRELEEFLFEHPRVKQVAVVGVNDARLGEVVAVFFITHDGKEMTKKEVEEACKGKIARFKVPSHIFTEEAFPMTMSGKIQKFKLRQEANQRVLAGDVGAQS